jgi:hypothetical protein
MDQYLLYGDHNFVCYYGARVFTLTIRSCQDYMGVTMGHPAARLDGDVEGYTCLLLRSTSRKNQ